jgi:hypothetical protein
MQAELERLQRFARDFIPNGAPRIELHAASRPIFDLHGVEEEINRALERKVPLKSGGHLVIDQTESMTTIDVNTGGFVGHRNLEDTIFRTDLEAAVAIARQLRLRNLGGIIIIDFIDMTDESHRVQVLAALEQALAADHAQTQVAPLSALGLVEMTRKRTRESLEHLLCETCPTCDGHGSVRSVETVCQDIFRELLRQARQFTSRELLVLAHRRRRRAFTRRRVDGARRARITSGTTDSSASRNALRSRSLRRGAGMTVAALQMTSSDDVAANLATASRLLHEAAAVGARVAVLPENFAFMGLRDRDKLAVAEREGDGPIQKTIATLARQLDLWVVAGTMPIATDDGARVAAACLVFDAAGRAVARYDKIHLFDVDLPGETESHRESRYIAPGSAVRVIDTPVGRLGLAVCYDIRVSRTLSAPERVGCDVVHTAVRLHGADGTRPLGNTAAGARDRKPRGYRGARAMGSPQRRPRHLRRQPRDRPLGSRTRSFAVG